MVVLLGGHFCLIKDQRLRDFIFSLNAGYSAAILNLKSEF